jgi:hypothetical protein
VKLVPGAVLGALIGAIAGGGKGAAIGTAVGAGSGTAVQAITHGEQVNIPPETKLEFTLRAPLTVKKYQLRVVPSLGTGGNPGPPSRVPPLPAPQNL